jgi:hypothetical protein
MPKPYPYRVFVSYSHDDILKARKIKEHLRTRARANPISDENLPEGFPFSNEIKLRIAYAHVFMPLLTHEGCKRPWVHQEIGYAKALDVPVFPLATEALPEFGMVKEIQAGLVGPRLEHLRSRVTWRKLQHIVEEARRTKSAPCVGAQSAEERTETLVKYATEVTSLGQHGRLRQRSPYTSFSIPKKDPSHPDWKTRAGDREPHTDSMRRLLLQEREILEEHVRQAGCDLIIDPFVDATGVGERGSIGRLEILREFLTSKAAAKVRILVLGGRVSGNLTIVGDWFAAEAVAPFTGREYRGTIFTRHAPSVLEQVHRFDREFQDELQAERCTPAAMRATAIRSIDAAIESLARRLPRRRRRRDSA